jgi:hypothetical protein
MTREPSPALPRAGPLRSPLRVWALAVLTLGVYGVVHHHAVNRELRDFGVEVRPALSVLALVPGVVALVPPFVTLWRTTDRIGVAQETAGLTPSTSAPLGASALALWLFAPYHQRELNKVWRADRAGSPTPTRASSTHR